MFLHRIPSRNPQTSRQRFKLPKATLPTLHYLSVSQEDFLDPRYADDIVKTYGIPRYFFKSKSKLLLGSAGRRLCRPAADHDISGGGATQPTLLSTTEARKQMVAAVEKEAEDARPKTSDSSAAIPKFSNRLPIVVPIATMTTSMSPERQRSQSALNAAKELAENDKDELSGASSKSQPLPQMLPLYKPLIGEKYTHARFFPPMNPYRSLQLESEVTKYVEHKKRVGLGR